MKKIKILRIIGRLNIGGPAINAILLTDGLDRTRFETILIYGSLSRGEGNMLDDALQKNIKPYFIPELKRELNFFNDLIAFKKIYHMVKTEQPDIIHTHTAKAGTLGRLAGILYNFFTPRVRRIRLIHTFHGHIFSGYFNIFKVKFFIFIERGLAFFTSKIVTVSESIKNELIFLAICRKDKIEVIPLGLELDKFLDIPISDNHILNVGIVGRLAPIKNHRLFLETVAKVVKNNPEKELKFKIIGDGELRQELEDLAHKLNINTQVIFLGWRKDLVPVYSDLDIITLTSKNEGTPVSLIEAMASGRAVVATDVGGVRDLLGKEIDTEIGPNENFKVLERGLIVKSGDAFSFANALVLLLQDSRLRKEVGMRGRDFVKIRFMKDRLIKDMEDLYKTY